MIAKYRVPSDITAVAVPAAAADAAGVGVVDKDEDATEVDANQAARRNVSAHVHSSVAHNAR